MKEKDYPEEEYAGMTEKSWISNKKEIIKRLAQNDSTLSGQREQMLAAKKALEEEMEGFEQENYSVLNELNDLEMQYSEKNDVMQKLKLQLQNLKNELVIPLAEESGCLSEIQFLQSEKERLFEVQDRTAEELNSNMAALGNTIMEIEFIKGEISTLMDKVITMEEGLPDLFGEVGELDEKIQSVSKALKELYDRMRKSEKDAKILYYERE